MSNNSQSHKKLAVFVERPMSSGAILGALIRLWQNSLLILLCAATGHWK